jgi:hypothetical protein
MCLNYPIPWEMASLGDDLSLTWVEGIVNKLPPRKGIPGHPTKIILYEKVLRSCKNNLPMSVVTAMLDIYQPLEKGL